MPKWFALAKAQCSAMRASGQALARGPAHVLRQPLVAEDEGEELLLDFEAIDEAFEAPRTKRSSAFTNAP